MIRVLHLLDETTHDDAFITLRQLLSRLSAPVCEHIIGLTGCAEPPTAGGETGRVLRFGRRWGWTLAAALPVRSAIRDRGVPPFLRRPAVPLSALYEIMILSCLSRLRASSSSRFLIRS